MAQEPRLPSSGRPSRELRRDRALLRLERMRTVGALSKELSELGHEIDELERARQETERALIESSAEADPATIKEWTDRLTVLQRDLEDRYEAFQTLLARKEMVVTEFDQKLAALVEN